MNLFKRCFIAIIFIFLLLSPILAVDYFNNPAYIAQNGFGETEQIAKQNALGELSKFFQTSINVNAVQKTKVTDFSSQSEISEEVFIKSQTELFAVHYTKAKYNKKQKLYELTAYIDREEAWQIYKQKLESDVQSFENFYSDSENQTEIILKISGLLKAIKIAKENELEKKLDFALFLYPKSDDLYSQTRTHFLDSESLVKKLCRECFIKIECESDQDERIQKTVAETFSKIGIGTKNNADYICRIYVTENENHLSAGFFFTPGFTLEILKNENVIFSSSGQIKRIGAKDESIARQRAYSVLANSISEIISSKFLFY